MIDFKKVFMYSPGGDSENSSANPNKNNDDKKDSPEQPLKGKEEEHPSLIKKVKDALQEWSNKDEEDLEFDDTRV